MRPRSQRPGGHWSKAAHESLLASFPSGGGPAPGAPHGIEFVTARGIRPVLGLVELARRRTRLERVAFHNMPPTGIQLAQTLGISFDKPAGIPFTTTRRSTR